MVYIGHYVKITCACTDESSRQALRQRRRNDFVARASEMYLLEAGDLVGKIGWIQ
jgi:hypothetical protein